MTSQTIVRVRQSSVRTFRVCEMKYNLAVNHKLVPRHKSVALHIGTICHAGRAEWLRTFDPTKAIQATIASIKAECILFPSLKEIPPKVTKKGDHYADCVCVECITRLCVETIASYCQSWPSRFGSDFVVHSVEQKFEHKLCSFEDLDLIYEGTCDADVSYGRLRVNFEYKTTKLEFAEFMSTERMSLQHTVYPYILEQEKGVPFYGTLIDVTKKPTKEKDAEHSHDIIVKTDEQYEKFVYEQTELLKRLAYHIEKDFWPQNDMSCKTLYGKCPYLRLCVSNFSRTAMQEFYVVEVPEIEPLERESD